MSKFIGEMQSSGGGEIAAGAALLIVGILTANPYLIVAGISEIVQGIGTLTSKGPLSGSVTSAKNPVAPWVVLYGQCETGGTLIPCDVWECE